MDLRDIYAGLNGVFSHIVVFLCTVALAIMFSRISKTWDRKVHRTRKNVRWKIDESGPFSQPLPEASHDEESGPFSQALPGAFHGTPRCDEASSSGYSDLPKRSEGQDVDVNLNTSGVPRCDEAPSSSSSSGPTKSRSDLISSKRKDKVEDVNLDDLWKHIFELRNPREKGSLRDCPWSNVPHLQYLKGIVSLRSDPLIKDIHGAVRAILGRVNVATVAPLVVVHTLETLAACVTNREERRLTKVIYDLAIDLKRLSERPEGMQDVMQEATSLIVEGARVFYFQVRHRRSTSELSAITQKLKTMYMHIKTEFTVPVFTPIQHQRRSHLSKEYPTHADNGQVFKIEALVSATNNFHKDNEVGSGGFGFVYKGTTHDGKQIAVKKMSFTSDKRSPEFLKKQFENEKLLTEVQHRNLVNLLGSCEQEAQGFLVYEYLPNKSLDKFQEDPENRKRLDWHKRFNIIEGIAQGLVYLHRHSRVRIIHGDIKPGNILLDETLNPKIADFGTAKLFPEDRTHVTATTPVGTPGYMAPEYPMTRQFTERTDVYSFGIVLLELLTGEKISPDGFLERVWSSYKKKKFVPTIDPTMTEAEKAKALRCIQVGLLCIQEDSLRPTMTRVITMLSTSENLPVPKKPPFQSSTRRSWF